MKRDPRIEGAWAVLPDPEPAPDVGMTAVTSSAKDEGPNALVDDPFAEFCRPKLAVLLGSLKLDVTYERAVGNYLYRRTERTADELVSVLDLVGGFGAALLGHNHPELASTMVSAIQSGVPVMAQGGNRRAAGELARKLNQLVKTAGHYYCIFTNSGAESVEAALKHAYKVRFDVVRRHYEDVTRKLHDVVRQAEQTGITPELPGGRTDIAKLRDDLDEHNLAQLQAFQDGPTVFALKGGFHGKTSSALKVTFNRSYREGFEGLSAIRPVFLDPDRPELMTDLAMEARIEFMVTVVEGERLVIRRETESKVIALILEVILGEGGIRPVPENSLATLARLHGALGIPYILDEIQTGCGRTGSVFGWHDTALRAIEPDYIVLSKALGGGMVKIGATMIHEGVHDPDFGVLHTSTFAEDELSCVVASRTLDIITREGGKVLQEVRAKGARLLEELRALCARHPRVFREARGRGLMLGLEFQDLEESGPLFRYAAKQGFLSLLVASYLLEYHRIRILAPLTTLLKGNPGKRRSAVLRVQPPVTVTRDETDRFLAALDEVARIIEANQEGYLVGHLFGETPWPEQRQSPSARPVEWPAPKARVTFDARVGFLMHPTSLSLLIEFYFPSFLHQPQAWTRLAAWWDKLCRFLEPDLLHRAYVQHDGFVLEANVICIPYLPETMISIYKTGKRSEVVSEGRRRLQELQDRIQEGLIVARDLGDEMVPTSIVGLGAYTSIVTDQGAVLNDYEIPITTGNAYTVGLLVQGVEVAAKAKGMDLVCATAAVVGAAGNIGSALATILATRCRRLVLVGRRGSSSSTRLAAASLACIEEARNAGRDLEVSQATTLDAIKHCDIVVVATNSSDARLISPTHVKAGAIVLSASVPSNLSLLFRNHLDNHVVFDGGYARLPVGNEIRFVGMPGNGLAFGCLSETLLTAFEGDMQSFAKGALSRGQIARTLALAERHGFELGEFRLGKHISWPTRAARESFPVALKATKGS